MVLQRLKQYIDSKGISIASFEKSVGMSNASFGKCLKKGGSIGTDKLENILRVYTDISPEWLLTGEGGMLVGQPSESAAAALPASSSEARVRELEHQRAILMRSLDIINRQLEALLGRPGSG